MIFNARVCCSLKETFGPLRVFLEADLGENFVFTVSDLRSKELNLRPERVRERDTSVTTTATNLDCKSISDLRSDSEASYQIISFMEIRQSTVVSQDCSK